MNVMSEKMIVDVEKVKKTRLLSEPVEIAAAVDCGLYGYPEFKLLGPLEFKGAVDNANTMLELKGVAKGKFSLECGRCLEKFEGTFEVEVAETYTNKAEVVAADEEDAIILFEGDEIDIADVVLEALFLEMPASPLCDDDCHGLCQSCGANLNLKPCACKSDDVDIRLEKLKELLDSMNLDSTTKEV